MKGRKRHILVDTEGFVLKAKIHSAKVMDYEGIKTLLHRARERFPRLRHLWLDAGLPRRGQGRGLGEEDTGMERGSGGAPEKKPAPEEVMMAWASEWAKEGVAVDWQKLMPQRLPGVAEEVGGGADDRLDRPAKEDE